MPLEKSLNERGAPINDFAPQRAHAVAEVLAGLTAPHKSIPTWLLYDARGMELFEAICQTDEYYPTRTELSILRENIGEMADLIGPQTLLIEYGSGTGQKTQLLLDHLKDPVAYVPIEISREALRRATNELGERYPRLLVSPICADYTSHYELPELPSEPARRTVFFPGSTLGNFERDEARDFLSHIGEAVGKGGSALVGVDLHKDSETLERAYDDSGGITADFELNALEHMNRELDANFVRDRFEYRSFYNRELQRIEMYLVSRERQNVRVDGTQIELGKGEHILTEYSQKFTLESFRTFAAEAGFSVGRVWVDDRSLFSVQYLERK